jgi:hypothetical protein
MLFRLENYPREKKMHFQFWILEMHLWLLESHKKIVAFANAFP